MTIKALIEETKQLMLKFFEIEYGDISRLITLFGLSRFWFEEKIFFFTSFDFRRSEIVPLKVDERNEPCSFAKKIWSFTIIQNQY